MSAFGGERAGGLRLLRIVVAAVGVGTVANTIGLVVAFSLIADRVDQINAERSANVIRNCEDVNRRHDEAVKTVDRILRPRLERAGRVERARLEASRETTVSLVEALTPLRNCERLARQQVENP